MNGIKQIKAGLVGGKREYVFWDCEIHLRGTGLSLNHSIHLRGNGVSLNHLIDLRGNGISLNHSCDVELMKEMELLLL